MRILVDADACPVKSEIVSVAKEFKIDVTMYFDTSHQFDDGYSEVIIVDKGPDAVDLALINACEVGDVVVTQDYGVAAMALAKKCYAINMFGMQYTDFNIDSMLFQRANSQKLRRSGVRTKGSKKRVSADNVVFFESFKQLIQSTHKT